MRDRRAAERLQILTQAAATMLGRLAILSRELEPRHSDSADERERMPWKDKLAPSSAGALAPAQGRLVFCEPSLCLGLVHAVWSHLHLLRIRKPRTCVLALQQVFGHLKLSSERQPLPQLKGRFAGGMHELFASLPILRPCFAKNTPFRPR